MSPEESVARLRRDMLRLNDDMARLHTQMQRLQQRTDQLSALREAEEESVRRVSQLETVLDVSAASSHVQAAVARAPQAFDPVAHVVVEDLFPAAVQALMVAAIPPVAFFEGVEDQPQELRVPQGAGLLPAVVTWGFVTEVVLRALAPALIIRFEGPLAEFARAMLPSLAPFQEWGVDMTLTQGRVVRSRPGAGWERKAERPWDFLTGVVPLGHPHEAAVVWLGPSAVPGTLPIAPSATLQTERYTYEFGIGPTRESRRTLIARMSQQDAATWARA